MLTHLYNILTDTSSLTAIVDDRIFPIHLPQSATLPAITFQQISSTHDYHIAGAAGVTTARVQIDCWANSPTEACDAGEAIRQTLQGTSGMWDTTEVLFVQLDSCQDMAEPPQDGSDQWIYRRSSDYLIKYRE